MVGGSLPEAAGPSPKAATMSIPRRKVGRIYSMQIDVWGWAAIALFLGPVLAALAIPVFRWLFEDARRLLFVVALASAIYWKVTHK